MSEPPTRAYHFRSASLMETARILAKTGGMEEQKEASRSAAMIFSILAVECYINEFPHKLEYIHHGDPMEERLVATAQMLEQLEEQKAPLRTKLQLLMFVLTGKQLDKGRKTFQDFWTLVEARNTLVHPRSSLHEVTLVPSEVGIVHYYITPPERDLKLGKKLASAAGDHAYDGGWDWWITREECAAWATETAEEVIKAIALASNDRRIILAARQDFLWTDDQLHVPEAV